MKHLFLQQETWRKHLNSNSKNDWLYTHSAQAIEKKKMAFF